MSQQRPWKPKLPKAKNHRRGFFQNLALVPDQDGVEVLAVFFGHEGLGRLALQRSKAKTFFAVDLDQKIHEAVTKMTDAVKKNDCLRGLLIGHMIILGVVVMKVFLFPLVNVTLFPKTTKPLNIFENRYLEMVKASVETQTPIAIGYIEDPSLVVDVAPGQKVPFVREIAGYGSTQIVEERLNGTQLVFLHGLGKCRLGPVLESGTPYLVCSAEPVLEEMQVEERLNSRVQALNKILARWIHTHIPDPIQREIFLRNLNGPEEIVGAFAAYLVRDYDLQQMVLEFSSLSEKVEFLHRLAESNEITA